MKKGLFTFLSVFVILISGGSCVRNENNESNNTALGTAELLGTTSSAGGVQNLKIVVNGAGKAVAVWAQHDGTRYNAWTSLFDGISWTTAELLENDDIGDALGVNVVINDVGEAIAFWRQSDGSQYKTWTNRFDGISWGTAKLFESDEDGVTDNISIAMYGADKAIAVWGDGGFVWASSFDGASWGTAELISSIHMSSTDGAEIAIDDTGHAIVIWSVYDEITQSKNLWANVFDGTSWETAQLIGADILSDGIGPYQIATDDAGNALAVWPRQRNGIYSIWANHYDGTAWEGAEMLADDIGGGIKIFMHDAANAVAVYGRPGTDFNFFNGSTWEIHNDDETYCSQIAINGSGNAVSVWSTDNNNLFNNIMANHFNGSTWGIAEPIEDTDASFNNDIRVVMDGAGKAVSVWYRESNSTFRVWTNRFDGTAWGTAKMIENSDTGQVSDLKIVSNSTGDTFAAWVQRNQSNHSVWAHHYR